MYQAIIFGVASVLALLLLALTRKKDDATFTRAMKIGVLAFAALGFFRFMLSDAFIYVINDGYLNGVHYQATDLRQSLLRWGYYLGYSVLPMAVFFESRFFRNVALVFSFPMTVLSTVFFHNYMAYFLDPTGRGLHFVPWLRYFLFATELVLALVIPVALSIRRRHFPNFLDGGERLRLLLGLPCLLLVAFPVYLPQSIFGYSRLSASGGSSYHYGWVAILLVVTAALYYGFRFRPYRERYMLIVFLTVLLFFHYDSLYLMGFSINRLPVQLCNLAAYLYLFAIIFRMKRLFDFCFIVNLTGTLVAIITPDFMPGAFGFWNMHFILEHSLVMMIPALAMGLRIFPRVERKSLKYAAVGFNVYFFFCLIFGFVMNAFVGERGLTVKDGVLVDGGPAVNYFFLFDIDAAVGHFSFLDVLERCSLTIAGFTLYPLLILLIYFAFSLLWLLFYRLVKYLYRVEDDHYALRLAEIDLYERITKKKSKRPRSFPTDAAEG